MRFEKTDILDEGPTPSGSTTSCRITGLWQGLTFEKRFFPALSWGRNGFDRCQDFKPLTGQCLLNGNFSLMSQELRAAA